VQSLESVLKRPDVAVGGTNFLRAVATKSACTLPHLGPGAAVHISSVAEPAALLLKAGGVIEGGGQRTAATLLGQELAPWAAPQRFCFMTGYGEGEKLTPVARMLGTCGRRRVESAC